MLRGPKQYLFTWLFVSFRHVFYYAQGERLNLIGFVSVDFVNRPRSLEVETWFSNFLHYSETLQYRLFIGMNHDETATYKQHGKLNHQDER